MPSIGQISINISSQFGSIWHLLNWVAFLSGVVFLIIGIQKLVQSSASPYSGGQGELKSAFMALLVGSLLLAIGGFIDAISETLFGNAQVDQSIILNYIPSGQENLKAGTEMVIGFVKLIGFTSCIRSLFIFNKIGQPNAALPGGGSPFASGLTHLLAGLFALKIEYTAEILISTILG